MSLWGKNISDDIGWFNIGAYHRGMIPMRTGMTTVGQAGSPLGLPADDPTVQPRWGKIGKQKIEDAGPLPPEPMETVDDEILKYPRHPDQTRPYRRVALARKQR